MSPAEKLSLLAGRGTIARRIVGVVAHPDDEIIGFGGQLPDLPEIRIIHVTDGAPDNPADAERAGCPSRDDYARLRRGEAEAALWIGGVAPEQLEGLHCPDQQASYCMVELAERLAGRLAALGADLILTHAYEGGHPDHDATAFIVQAAVGMLDRQVPVIEMAGYHARKDEWVIGNFLPDGRVPVLSMPLAPDRRELKRRMMDAHGSQAETLARFPVHLEQFRPAPLYDFTRPPHPGTLLYELYDWGMVGQRWRRLADAAARRLGRQAA